MRRLWRPWRMAYVRGGSPSDEGCFLCSAASRDPGGDADVYVLGRGRSVLAILNRFPYNTGHLMVAPYRHVAELDDLDPDEAAEMWDWTTRSVAALRATTQPQGFNVGLNLGTAAGAGVPGHLHVHVVPRWEGDTNFMPVLGSTKVLPEMLDETYRALRPAFG